MPREYMVVKAVGEILIQISRLLRCGLGRKGLMHVTCVTRTTRDDQPTPEKSIVMDSSSPVIFKRTKAKHTARARDASPENETDKTSNTGEDSPSTLALKLKNKIKRNKAKSRLSFGGDEDEVRVSISLKNIP